MIRISFLGPDGELTTIAEGREGESLLELGQAHGLPLEGTCEGQMACSTCHVIIDPADFGRLPPAIENEEDMLDLAAATTRTSRLSCQITLTPDLDGMKVRLPGEARNMQGL